jgi:nitrate reductase alpha subunit
MCDVEPDQTIAPLEHHVRDKVPYPTATRRIQFYLDHPLYEELDEVLPRHKQPPAVGGDFPLVLTGGHTRWSIHAAWRDSETMLRLHRGAPFLLIAAEDAAARQRSGSSSCAPRWLRSWVPGRPSSTTPGRTSSSAAGRATTS